MKKKNKKQSDKKQINDLTSYFNPDMLKYDTNGSYTGLTEDMMIFDDMDDRPIQDADDL